MTDLPRCVLPGQFQTSLDDKNGFQHVKLHSSSETYFAFEWKGYYFTFSVFPFGWKASAFIYHSLGLAVSHVARYLGVPISQYIDDGHVGQSFIPPTRVAFPPSRQNAEAAAHIICYLLIEAGYLINIEKSQHVPSTSLRFLGFVCDSLRQSFLMPQDKNAKFITLRESILSSSMVNLNILLL